MNRVSCLGLGTLLLAFPLLASGAEADAEGLAKKIDQRIAAAWGKEVKPAPRADDAEFFRRIHLDLAGRIPSVTEIRDFLEDDRPDKRRIWVERMLQGDADDTSYNDAYPSHFANTWRAWLLAQTNQQAPFQQPGLEAWLRTRLKSNSGYDQLVRELITQQQNPANPGDAANTSAFFLANESKPENLAGSTARLFLGVKLECAQCHSHPFAEWTRDQFWEYAAFFTDVAQQARPNQPAPTRLPRGEIKVMGTERVVKAKFLDGKEPAWKDANGTRPTLVEWMTSTENPYFAKAAVNRMWIYFFGVSLAESTDGPCDANAAELPELLNELAQAFIASKYDVKLLIRAIMASEAYQRTSAVSDPSQQEFRLFARMPLRGLSPEQLFDSLAVATEYQETLGGDPRFNFIGGPQSARGQFLAKFPIQESRTDYQTSILQSLYLMNNEFIADRSNPQRNRTLATLAEQRTSTARKIESLYLVALSRKPSNQESERFVKYVDAGGSTGESKKALSDVFWVLLNSPEFMLNH